MLILRKSDHKDSGSTSVGLTPGWKNASPWTLVLGWSCFSARTEPVQLVVQVPARVSDDTTYSYQSSCAECMLICTSTPVVVSGTVKAFKTSMSLSWKPVMLQSWPASNLAA